MKRVNGVPARASSEFTRRLCSRLGWQEFCARRFPLQMNLLRAEKLPIESGFPVPLTGPFNAQAQDQVRAAQVAIDEFNSAEVWMAARRKSWCATTNSIPMKR